jgi:hypothetical protein
VGRKAQPQDPEPFDALDFTSIQLKAQAMQLASSSVPRTHAILARPHRPVGARLRPPEAKAIRDGWPSGDTRHSSSCRFAFEKAAGLDAKYGSTPGPRPPPRRSSSGLPRQLPLILIQGR